MIEEKATIKKKYKSTTKTKRKSPKKYSSAGRPKTIMGFKDARELVRSERLSSKNDFLRWWNLNLPARIPKNPARSYMGEWMGWGDFLNVYNSYPDKKLIYRPFHEARTYARSLMIKTKAEWLEYGRAGKLPNDIPIFPNNAYGKTISSGKLKRGGHWVSWKDWLGATFADRIDAEIQKIEVLIVHTPKSVPRNVYAFTLIRGHMHDILSSIKKLQPLKVYVTENDYDWGSELERKYNLYYNTPGLYMITNINDILYDYGMNMDEYRV